MSFRQIDIDALEGSRWVDDSTSNIDASEVESITTQRVSEVKQLLSKGKYVEALSRSLEDPPYGGDDKTKNTSCQVVLESLGSFKTQEVSEALQQLSPEGQDVLMKYVFRAMANPSSFNCAVALAWHEKLVEANGTSSIVRVLTDRRTV